MKNYRADIDGLRAVAVLPVVFFHAGFPLFSGGFVGVDIFFVISGFLITGIIQRDLDVGRFSIATFYERRIRRIFPALFVVVFVSAIAAWFLLVPRDFRLFSKGVVALIGFGSNDYFWKETGYFDVGAATKPLLHTWSLSVEEQFYILFPPLLLLLHKLSARRRNVILLALFVASLLGCIWATPDHPSAAFFFSPFRAWELLLGALLALGAVPGAGSRGLAEIGGAAGLCLIAVSVFVFGAETPFPGFMALIPCLGAAFLLQCGDHDETRVSRMLSHPAIVHLGRISYSLYLWHWPLIVFFGYYAVFPISRAQALCIVALSLMLAHLSWKFVEMPIRARKRLATRRAVFAAAAAVMVVGLALGGGGQAFQGWEGRFLSPETADIVWAMRKNLENTRCQTKQGALKDQNAPCFIGAASPAAGSEVWALWGDSHAAALASMLAAKANAHGIALRFFGQPSCPPLLGVRQTFGGADNHCFEFNQAVMQALLGSNVTTVVLAARYSVYLYGGTRDFGPAEDSREPLITDESSTVRSPAERRDLFTRKIEETVDRLSGRGIRTVLVYPVPETGYDIPSTLLRLSTRGADLSEFKRPVDYYWSRNRPIFAALDAVQGDRVARVYPHTRLCGERDCIVSKDRKPLYRDDDHLSDFGAALVAPLFDPLFAAPGSEARIGQNGATIAAPNP